MQQLRNFPKEQILSVNGIELEVFEAGQQHDRPPVVLCHGWPEHAFSWRHQIPALAAAGYHVIVPNQRGFGNSSCPETVTDYDISCLTGDLAALLDHYGYKDAWFVGHDWGANVVWSMALLHPNRVRGLINLALPYQVRTPKPWIAFMEEAFGPDNYFVHFNRQPGVADAVLDDNAARFLRNLYRKNVPPAAPEPGMLMINLALADGMPGDAVMAAHDLAIYIEAFQKSGFTASINWYRNLDRNWQILADIDPIIRHPALMIYGLQDMIPPSEILSDFVPNVETVSLDCGHWIQQEQPEETTRVMLDWLQGQRVDGAGTGP